MFLHIISDGINNIELTAFFFIGLFGGAHCLGMCGPLVTMYAENLGSKHEKSVELYEIRQHGLFNLGRTVSYIFLGGFFGLLGSIFFNTASILIFEINILQGLIGIFIGLWIVLMGVYYIFKRQETRKIDNLPVFRQFGNIFRLLQRKLNRLVDGPGIFGLGLIHGLLPCPLLYPAYLYVFSQGSVLTGVLGLGLLGLGTFPTLFLYGAIFQSFNKKYRDRLHMGLGIAFLVLGVMPIAHGLELFGVNIPHIDPPIYQPIAIFPL